MDSPSSSISSLAPSDATQLLKELLKVGKARSEGNSGSEGNTNRSVESDTMELIGDVEDEHGSNHDDGVMDQLMQSMESLPKQQIILRGDDANNSFSVYGREVDIIVSLASGSTHTTAGSNKVKINPVVNFDWEHKHYLGNLVAVHRNGIHIAYVLKGKSGGIVRVINRKTAERTLVKGFKGQVTDVAFAHVSAIIMGTVDEIGNMFIHEIIENEDGKIDATVLVQVIRPDNTLPSYNHRLIWCPYIPEEEDSSGHTTLTESSVSDDVSRLLVLTHNEIAEMWNVDTVYKEYGNSPVLNTEVDVGYLTISSHTMPITDAAFSPDGSALATASLDGEVKFFQVYLQDKSAPRCLHQWQPHGGKPVSSIFFLDDHKHPNPEVQFWKFAVTGADYNREIKVWSCESWMCLQTINFRSPPDLPSNFQVEACIKSCMDLSAQYLVLSDIKRKVLYALQFHQDSEAGRAHVSSVSEFLLTQPCLSFAILDAVRKRFKTPQDLIGSGNVDDMTTGEIDAEDEEEVGADEDGPNVGVLIKMYSVHTKALQELQIRYKPESLVPQAGPGSVSSSSQDEIILRDALSDVSMETVGSDLDGGQSDRSHHSIRSHHSQRSPAESLTDRPLLLTPDAFTSSSPRKNEGAVGDMTVRSSGSTQSSSSFTQVTAMNEDLIMTPIGSAAQTQISPNSSLTITPVSSREFSGGSSHGATPTSVPAAATTPPNKEDIIGTPPTTVPPGGVLLPSLPIPSTSEDLVTPVSSMSKSDNFLTSTASYSQEQGVLSSDMKVNADQHAGHAKEMLEDIFGSSQPTHHHRTMLHSAGSSSSTSLEVSEILGEGRRGMSDPSLEEGEEQLEDAASPDILENMATTAQVKDVPSERDHDISDKSYNSKIWPKPPEVPDVSNEAKRLATEALENAALHSSQINGAEEEEEAEEEDEDIGDAGARSSTIIQRDDDVRIEEEEVEGTDEPPVTVTPPSEKLSDAAIISTGGIAQPLHGVRRISPPVEAAGARGEPGVLLPAMVDHTMIQSLQSSMNQVLNLLQAQQRQIELLQTNIEHDRQTHNHKASMDDLQSRIDSMEGALAARVARALAQHSQEESQRMQQALNERELMDKQRQERVLSSLTQAVNNSVATKLDRAVKTEITNVIVPAVRQILQPLKDELHTEIATKLTATDSLMKENIGKLVKSRQTVEAIGQAAGNAIQGSIQAAYRDAFQAMVMPGFERTCQTLFSQVNDTFQRGTHEYMHQLETHLDRLRHQQESTRDPILSQLQSTAEAFHTQTEQMQSSIIRTLQAEVETHVRTTMTSLEDALLTHVRRVVQEELSVALQEQQNTISDSVLNAMRSGAVTPVPLTPDPQQQQVHVLGLLRQGQINVAFQQALSASDLGLVMLVCEKVNPSQVFNQTPCPLDQPVILSLIQQLAADLMNHTELKYRYLQEALMNLDPSDAITKEHMPTVLGNLVDKLTTFLQAHPQHKMARSIRMLMMASQSFLK